MWDIKPRRLDSGELFEDVENFTQVQVSIPKYISLTNMPFFHSEDMSFGYILHIHDV